MVDAHTAIALELRLRGADRLSSRSAGEPLVDPLRQPALLAQVVAGLLDPRPQPGPLREEGFMGDLDRRAAAGGVGVEGEQSMAGEPVEDGVDGPAERRQLLAEHPPSGRPSSSRRRRWRRAAAASALLWLWSSSSSSSYSASARWTSAPATPPISRVGRDVDRPRPRRRSKSSVRANCSSGSEPGRSATSATMAGEQRADRSGPRRARRVR